MNTVDYRTQTTLVTGASSGLGSEFAYQLAKRGSDVVLVARRRDRLETLAAELTATSGIQATAIPLDLGVPSAGETLAEEVARRGLTVTSLVNNAGFGTYGPFHETDAKRLGAEIGLNVTNLVDVTRAFINGLRAAGSGVLINVASVAAYQPVPNMAVYAATKAFVLNFTEALWQESLGTGLRVIALSPGATRTEFFDVIGTDDASGGVAPQSPQQVVATVLRTLDRSNPPPSVISGAANHLRASASRLLTRRRMVLTVASVAKGTN